MTGLVSVYFMGVKRLFVYVCAVVLYVYLSMVFGYVLLLSSSVCGSSLLN